MQWLVQQKRTIFYISCLVLILYIASGNILSFGFWKDDWISYWSARVFSPQYYLYWFHPGTTIQFGLLTFLLPPNSLGWQLVGFAWKLLAAFAVGKMITVLTDSPKQGSVAGILFAASPLGLDATAWPSATVVLLNTFFLCMTNVAWIQRINQQGRAPSRWLWVWLVVSIFVDPFRTFPILLFVLGIVGYYKPELLKKTVGVLKYFFWALPFISISFVFLLLPRMQETTVYKFVAVHGFDVSSYIAKMYVIGNFFQTIATMVTGLFVQTPEELSTGMYNRIGARLGLMFLMCIVGWIFYLYKFKSNKLFSVMFLFGWTLLFYLPNFMSEPRLSMGITHRYTTVSGVGIIGLLVIWLFSIRPRIVSWILCVTVIVLSIRSTQGYVTEWGRFRSRTLLQTIWNQVNRDVSAEQSKYIFIFSGGHPVIANVLNYSGPIPFVIARKISDPDYFPIMLGNISDTVPYVCTTTSQALWNGTTTTVDPYSLQQVYSWNIDKSGKIIDTSIQSRLLLDSYAQKDPRCTNE